MQIPSDRQLGLKCVAFTFDPGSEAVLDAVMGQGAKSTENKRERNDGQ